MMNLKEELEKAQAKQREVVSQIQGMESMRQNLLQEALRLEGEIRAIQKLIAQDGAEAGK